MPLLPLRIACQVSSVPIPTGLISPTPVTTTERDRFWLNSLGIRSFLAAVPADRVARPAGLSDDLARGPALSLSDVAE
jgi:hypothetical protein